MIGEDAIHVLRFCLVLFIAWLIWYRFWIPYRVDYFRQRLFKLRDELFEYANVESEQMTRTMSLTSEWNTASFFDSKKAVIGLIKPIAAKPREERLRIIQEKIKGDDILELNITNVLNYLEDLAVLVDKGFVNEDVLRELFQTNVLRYYDVFEPWIADLRNRRGNPGGFSFWCSHLGWTIRAGNSIRYLPAS